MKQKSYNRQQWITFIVIVLFQFHGNSQVSCTTDTPFFAVNLTGNPSGTWISPQVVRDGSCCLGGANQVNCIEFSITLDPSAVGINFSVFSGANPGGALYFQVNCQDVPMPTSSNPVCLSGPGPHHISYCKVGNNQNTYAITSVPGPYSSGDLVTSEGCSELLSLSGVNPASVSWNSISPGTSGQYNDLLSNTSGTVFGNSGIPFNGFSNVNVMAEIGSPSIVQYQVCGNVVSSCLTTPFCDTINVTIVPELDVTISPAQPYLCFGQSFETVTANVTAGIAPYAYLWSNGQTTSSINVTSGGTYSVSVTDANGCTVATDQVNVIQFTQPITANAGSDLTVCQANTSGISLNGIVTGTTTGIWTGGLGTYSINNTDLSLSYSFSGSEIASGSATLTLTTTNSGVCPIASDQIVITVSEITATIASLQPVSCFGGVNGSILVGVTGGTAPYQYRLNAGAFQASNAFNSLTAGVYSITVIDANLCTSTINVTITQPAQLTYTNTVTPVTCNTLCNGQITITASGGSIPYQYSSNSGTTFSPTSPLTGLCAGAYNIVVRDANNCLATSLVTVTQPTAVSATFVNTSPICPGQCNGSSAVTASGGTAGYQYSVNGGPLQVSSLLTGLCGGMNTIMVQDANGCQFTSSQNIINPPTYNVDTLSVTPSNCGFPNGGAAVEADGLNGPFTYTINGGSPNTTGLFPGLIGGAYMIQATDQLGCTASTFVGVSDVELDGITLFIQNTNCFGTCNGAIEVVNLNGFGSIVYDFDNSGIFQPIGFYSGYCAGPHAVTIRDAGSCVFIIPFFTTEPDQITFNTTTVNVACNGASTGQINFSGTTGGLGAYQYSIDGGTTFQSGTNFSGLAAGTYNLAVRDDSVCTVTGTATITQLPPVSYVFSIDNLTCNGNNSGFAQIVGSGGTGPYTFSMDGGTSFQGSPAFSGLAAGAYNIVVRDANLCTATGIMSITQPAALTSTYTPTNLLCNAACNGQIAFTAGGGTTPYQYSSDNGTTYSVNPTITNLCAGTYNLRVRDANGCFINAVQAITQPAPLTFTQTTVNSTCSLPNGSITFTANGGNGPYNYSTDNGVSFVTTNTITGLAANNYNLVVTDQNSCQATGSQIITNSPSPVINGVGVTNVSCNATCDGSITVSAIGGVGNIQYSIGGGFQSANAFTGLCAGDYFLSITDDNNCITNNAFPITITEPQLLLFNSNHTNLNCFEDGTGEIIFQVQGGTQPYQYSIDAGITLFNSNLFSQLDAQFYDLYVVDANNCIAAGMVTIMQPDLVEITNVIVSDAVCFQSCDGSAEVVAQGGIINTGYTYDWSIAGVSPDSSQIENLCEGSYSVVVQDDNGCMDSIDFVINEPLPIVIDSLTLINPLCTGSCDGSIIVWSSSASNYSFDGGLTFVSTNSQSNFCEGNYTVVIQSSEGCLATMDGIVFDPPLLLADAGPDSILCLGSSGFLHVNGSGGTEPYTYHWDNASTEQTQVVFPISDSTFIAYVEDANGCVSNLDSTLFNLHQELFVNVPSDTIVCPGEMVSLDLNIESGIPTFNYSWSQNGAVIGDGASINVSPTANSTYFVIINDFCTSVIDSVIVSVFEIPDITFDVLNEEACAPMEVVLFPTFNSIGGESNCTWTFSNGTVITGCDTVSADFINPGCYSVTLSLETADGCSTSSYSEDVFCVIENPVASFYYNPTNPTYVSPVVTFTNTSLNADTYNWTFLNYNSTNVVSPTVNFGNLAIGETVIACLTATNNLGCTDELCNILIMQDEFLIFVPNVFTPDNNDFNQVFIPRFPSVSNVLDYELLIFNRWGEMIFESHDPNVGWNGRYDNKISQDGVYIWKINLKDGLSNTIHNFVGHVSLIK